MPHNTPEINKALIELADEFNIKVVVTPDCHHSDTSQKEIQEFKLLMNTHGKVNKEATYEKSKKQPDMMKRLDYLYGEDRQITFNKFDIHLLSYEEMKAAMELQGIDRPDIYANTLLLADTVEDYEIQDGLNLLPVQYKSPDKELAKISLEGLQLRGLSENKEYLDRLDEELKIIKDKKVISPSPRPVLPNTCCSIGASLRITIKTK
jgi:DNA polymerase III alpha subunit